MITHAYVIEKTAGGTITNLYLLDTGKGYNQHASDLQLLKTYNGGLGFSGSSDGKKLFILSDDFATTGVRICKIEVMSAIGGDSQTIFSGFSNIWTEWDVWVIGDSSTSILFIIGTNLDTRDSAQQGLWRINADGTGLIHLNNATGPGNRSSHYPWSVFSRDGAFYANNGSYGLLSGGAMVKYTNDNVWLVGWTTM